MTLQAIDTRPYWSLNRRAPAFGRVDGPHEFDVVVVGAGVTGATTAYLLKREGLRVGLVDRQTCAAGDTAHTTAHLTHVTDRRLGRLVREIGEEHARACWDAGRAAIVQIADIVEREAIDCDFAWVPGYLHLPAFDGTADDESSETLRDEAALAARLGFDARYEDAVPLADRPGIRFAEQARIQPLRYLDALLGLVDGDGSRVFEESGVTAVEGDGPLRVTANDHHLRCSRVVIATHTPIVGQAGLVSALLLQTKITLHSSYVVAAAVPKGRVPDALFWDTASPYRYLRIQPGRDGDVVVFGGHDHKTGQETDARDHYARLEAELPQLVPGARASHRWSGQVIAPADGLPFIGFTATDQFASTGFNGNGFTFATVAAMMARDAFTGRRNPWRDLFDVNRVGLRGGAWDYVKENADYPYYLIRDRLRGVAHGRLRSLEPGQGAVIDVNGTRVAASRDQHGTVTMRSAVCPHLGCLVRWNAAEQTWDCPCHGSRFTPDGDVIAGPAEQALAEVDRE